MADPGLPPTDRTRETRLLVGTVVIAGGVLLLLAQLRFPGERRTVAPGAIPLERLAARATYDELAAIMSEVQGRLASSVVSLRVHAAAEDPRGDAWSHAYVPALRVAPDLALARVGPAWSGVELADGSPATVVARDHVRGLVTVRVPPDPAGAQVWRARGALTPPAYVALVEATRSGPLVHPLFVARTDAVRHPEWDEPMVALGGASGAPEGALLFSLQGQFIAMVVPLEGGLAAVPSSAVEAAAVRLGAGDVGWPGEIGARFAPLTESLARATGAESGAVVAGVDPQGPAAGRLRVGDVVRTIGGVPVTGPLDARAALARSGPAPAATLGVVRGGGVVEIEIPLAGFDAAAERELGLAWRDVPGVGIEILRVQVRTAAARAGLRAGDVVTQLDGVDLQDGRALRDAFDAARQPLVLGIRRGDARVVLALGPR